MSYKGKEKAIEQINIDSDEETSSSGSEKDKEKSGALDSPKSNLGSSGEQNKEEVFLSLESKFYDTPLPKLNPGNLPPPYIKLGQNWFDGPSSIRDPDIELAKFATASLSVPAPPLPPPELTKSGKPLTKKEKKELKQRTAGPDWFELSAPSESDLPRMYREVEALRLRNQLDPKRFYKKDEGEGKGIKGLPKYFAMGTILPSTTPFGTVSGDNLTRANRKRTLVEELVDDAEAKRYAKKKFEELQSVRGARGKNTLRAKQTTRKPKW